MYLNIMDALFRMILLLSELMIPGLLVGIVGFGLLQRKNIYELFVEGAADGMKTVGKVLPTLLALMMAVGILRASGFLDFLSRLLSKLPLGKLLPIELIPLIVVRLFSSSAATGVALDIFKNYGTDSFLGFAASLLMSSTETVFYTMSVYFLAAKTTKTRWTLPGALTATAAGIAASLFFANSITK